MDDRLISAVNKIISEDYIISRFRIKTERCCYINQNEEAILIPSEQENIRACIEFSLSGPRADMLLPLRFSQLTNNSLKFSSQSIRTFLSFILNSRKSCQVKSIVQNILETQLRLHPSCAFYMTKTYNNLFLEKDAAFNNLTILNFVLKKLKILLYGEDKWYRKCKNNFLNSNFAFSDECKFYMSDLNFKEQNENIKNDENGSEILNWTLWALDYLIRIILHNLHFFTNNNKNDSKTIFVNNIANSIIGLLIFDFSSGCIIDREMISTLFEVYVKCANVINGHCISKLIELIAELCMLFDTYFHEEESKIDFSNLLHFSSTFVNDFTIIILSKEYTSESLLLISRLNPEWLRLHMSFNLLQNIWKKKKCFGLQSVVNILNTVIIHVDSIESEVSSSSDYNAENQKIKNRRRALKRLDLEFCQLLKIIITTSIDVFCIEKISAVMKNTTVDKLKEVNKYSFINYELYENEVRNFEVLKTLLSKICAIHVNFELENIRIILNI